MCARSGRARVFWSDTKRSHMSRIVINGHIINWWNDFIAPLDFFCQLSCFQLSGLVFFSIIISELISISFRKSNSYIGVGLSFHTFVGIKVDGYIVIFKIQALLGSGFLEGYEIDQRLTRFFITSDGMRFDNPKVLKKTHTN